jgi:malate dehydrogenase (oxaloacetate-decarboxylating)
MEEADVFAIEAADVAIQAIKDNVARIKMTWDEAYQEAKKGIDYSRSLIHSVCDNGFIKNPPQEMLDDALSFTIKQIEGK